MIYERANISATNTDILSSGRLNAIPYNGILVCRFQAQLSDATNFYTITIQKPDGGVPVDAQVVPGTNPALAGILDERQLVEFKFRASQGGHFTISLTESGTAVCTFEIVLN